MSQQAQPHDNEPSTTDAEPNGEGSGRIIRMPRSVTSRTDSAEYKRLQEVARKTRTELKPVFMVLPRPWLSTSILFASDLVAISIAAIIGFIFRNLGSSGLDLYTYLKVSPLLLIIPVLFAWRGLYRIPANPPAVELRLICTSLTIAFLAFTSFAFLGKQTDAWSRSVWSITAIVSMFSVPMVRGLARTLFSSKRWWGAPVAILGSGQTGRAIAKQLFKTPGIGLKPIAYFDDDPNQNPADERIPYLGAIDDAKDFAEKSGVKHCIVAMPGAPAMRLAAMERNLSTCFPHVFLIPPYVGFISLWVEARDLAGALGLELRRQLLIPHSRFLKRSIDLLLVLSTAPLWMPLIASFGLIVKITSKGSMFYGQPRIGRNGKEFKAWKIRSMVADADERLKTYLTEHPELQEEWEQDHKLKNDPRITWIGKFIRATSIDEFPQLWNVLKGEMSLIGPRPVTQAESKKYGPAWDLYCQVLPGISGLWQISGRSETTYAERVMLDSYYVRNWSPWLDIWILAKTAWIVTARKGAC